MNVQRLTRLADYLDTCPLDEWDFERVGGNGSTRGCTLFHFAKLYPEEYIIDYSNDFNDFYELLDIDNVISDPIFNNADPREQYGCCGYEVSPQMVATKIRKTIDEHGKDIEE